VRPNAARASKRPEKRFMFLQGARDAVNSDPRMTRPNGLDVADSVTAL
jgi:hypothetical protein